MAALCGALRLSNQSIEISSIKVGPLLFNQKTIGSVGGAHLQNAIYPRIGIMVRARKVDSPYKGQSADLIQKGID